MASFISVPLKKTYEVDLVRPLRTFIQNTFTQANPDDYNQALSEFNKLRATMITKSVDKHESALEVLYRYYDQLVAIENKLPIAEIRFVYSSNGEMHLMRAHSCQEKEI